MPDPIRTVFDAALQGRALTAQEALALVPLLPARLTAVVAAAALASAGTGNAAARPERFTCGIINARSGRCTEDCVFCAQSQYHRTNAPVYPLVGEEALLDRARELAGKGAARMGIVTSGAGPTGADFERICGAARTIREKVGIRLCASLGMLTADKARKLGEAGFTCYHHNLETGRGFYPFICTTHAYEARLETVRRAGEAGLRVCSGGLFGLGESWAQRVELALTLRELDVDCIPVNFLMPVAGTGMERARPPDSAEGLGILALFRLMHPQRDIVICGGRASTLGPWDRLALFSCANGLMIGDYLTEKGGSAGRDRDLVRDLERFDGGGGSVPV